MRRWPLNRHRSAVARARLFFYKYGFASVLMGRFLGPIRATIPTVAGIMRMNMASFQVANILSAVLWVPIMLAPGYITARSLGTAENAQQIGLVVGTIASVVIGVGLLVMMVRKRRPARTARRDRPVS
jgi:membrane protein DedA with SNARE-associated domain